MKIPTVLDTDLGTDCDDAFALVYLLKNPNADIKAISTVIGNPVIRAKIVKKLERMLGTSVPIIAGESGPKEAQKYWTGIEELALTKEEKQEEFQSASYPTYTPDTKLVCIGPLTNIALQLQTNPSIRNVNEIYIMGSTNSSHNFKADLKAKTKVFEQPWNIYQITKPVSEQISFTRQELEQLKGSPLGDFLCESAIRWLDYVNKGTSEHGLKTHCAMYDVLVVSAALGEPYIKFEVQSKNRFVSTAVDAKLKDRIIEVIRN